jgi:hypothetical protein
MTIGASASVGVPLFQELSDQLPTIFLSGQAATNGRDLLPGEGHANALLARYLDEAWLGAGSDGAGELEPVRHGFIGHCWVL